MPEGQRVLLLGATGFLGRHVLRALEASGATVLPVAGRGGSADAWRRIDLVSGDVRALVREAEADVVVNCVGRATGDPAVLEAANVAIVARLVDAMARSPARLVHLGSAAEYGQGAVGRPLREEDAARPGAGYGRSKLRATELVTASGLDAVVLRIFNPVGRGMSAESAPGRAARLLADALSAGASHITMGSLSARRDFIHALDVADAVAAAGRLRGGPPIVNIGRGESVRARSIVAMLAEVAGFGGEIREEGGVSPRSADVDDQCADIALARRALGWAPRRSLREAAADLWAGLGR